MCGYSYGKFRLVMTMLDILVPLVGRTLAVPLLLYLGDTYLLGQKDQEVFLCRVYDVTFLIFQEQNVRVKRHFC